MTLLTLTFQNGQLLSHTARSAREEEFYKECWGHRLTGAPGHLWWTENEESKTYFKNTQSNTLCLLPQPNVTVCFKSFKYMAFLEGAIPTV